MSTASTRPTPTVLPALLAATLLAAIVASAFGQARAADGFAPLFHAGDTSVLVVEDLLPHVKALLSSRALRQAVQTGAVGGLVTAREGRVVDPAEWSDWLDRRRQWLPEQVAVGASEAGFADLDTLLKGLATADLLERTAAGRPEDVSLAADRTKLRQIALAELRQVRVPGLRVYARFRTAEDAAAAFGLMKDWVLGPDPAALPRGVTAELKGADTLAVHVAVGDLIGEDTAILATLVRAQLLDPATDGEAAARQAVTAVRAVSAEVSVERIGPGLLLTAGPSAAGGAAGVTAGGADLPAAVGQPDARTLAWARWDISRLKAAATGWVKLHEEWVRSTAYAEALREANAPPPGAVTPGAAESGPAAGGTVLDALRFAAARVRALPPVGAARAWVGADGSAVRWATVAAASPAPAPEP
ncbi:MAG: hypothetical protein JWO31_2341, partial [Phycisphaerales bacterium]|nr:hypothetical protein [Phycisphaerales bacterium]